MSYRAKNLSVTIAEKTILQDLSFEFKPGEINAIIGENGAGKSTLLNCLAGASPFDGELLFNQRSLASYSIAELAQYRAVLPQNSSLNFPFSVREVVRLSMTLGKVSTRDQESIIEECLSMVDAIEFIDRNYLYLSGGEKQRVQLARILAQLRAYSNSGNRFLLLDEPTSALDLKHQYATLNLLREIGGSFNFELGIVIIIHDLNLASFYCDKVLLLKQGKMVMHDRPNVVFSSQTVKDTFDIDVYIDSHPDTINPFIIPKLQNKHHE